MAPAVSGILRRAGLGLSDIDRFAFHPGVQEGRPQRWKTAFELRQGSLDHERAVLEEYGNMLASDRAFCAGAGWSTKACRR